MPKSSYEVRADCGNCGMSAKEMHVPKGTPLKVTECPNCKCIGALYKTIGDAVPRGKKS